jgi:hypothetical protein
MSRLLWLSQQGVAYQTVIYGHGHLHQCGQSKARISSGFLWRLAEVPWLMEVSYVQIILVYAHHILHYV